MKILILNGPSDLGLAPSHIVITTTLNWLSYFSPYHWAYGDSPLQTGNAWGGMGLLAGLCAVLFALGYAAFTRRDVC